MNTHDQIPEAYEQYFNEHASFEDKGVKALRKALGNIGKLTKERRKEIPRKKNNHRRITIGEN